MTAETWGEFSARLREVLGETYKPEGVEIVMASPLRIVGNRSTARDLWERGHSVSLMRWANGLTGGVAT